MSRVCHETGRNVENPFYSISAILIDRETGNVAYSDLEVSLSYPAVSRIPPVLLKEKALDLEGNLGFALETVAGEEGGMFGTVQLSSGVYDRAGNYQYLNSDDAKKILPKSFTSLLRKPTWVEKTEEGFQEATWAEQLYQGINK